MEVNKNDYVGVNLYKLKKEELLEDPNLAVWLAKYDYHFGSHPLAQEPEVLRLNDGKVAYWLAENCGKNKWGETRAVHNLEILKLAGREDERVNWLGDWLKKDEVDLACFCTRDDEHYCGIVEMRMEDGRLLVYFEAWVEWGDEKYGRIWWIDSDNGEVCEEEEWENGRGLYENFPHLIGDINSEVKDRVERWWENLKVGEYKKYDCENLTKEKLLDDPDLAVGLAMFNRDFGNHKLAQDLEVLSLNGGDVALELAVGSGESNWGRTDVAQNLDVLSFCDGEVAKALATHSDKNGWWDTPAAQNLEVLKLQEGEVANWLAWNSRRNRWGETQAAQDLRVLSLRDGVVARGLAEYSDVNGWGETDAVKKSEILSLSNGRVGELVKKAVERGKTGFQMCN